MHEFLSWGLMDIYIYYCTSNWMDFHVATKLFKESATYGGPRLTTEKAATEEDDDRTGDSGTGDSGMGTGSSGMGTGSGSIRVEDRKHGDWSPKPVHLLYHNH